MLTKKMAEKVLNNLLNARQRSNELLWFTRVLLMLTFFPLVCLFSFLLYDPFTEYPIYSISIHNNFTHCTNPIDEKE